MEWSLKNFTKTQFMDYLKNGIMIIDSSYKILYVNPAAEKLLKIDLAKVNNKNIYEVFPDALEDVRHLEHTIKFSFQENLRLAKRKLEKRLLEEHKRLMENYLGTTIIDSFIVWNFENDKCYIILVLKPIKV